MILEACVESLDAGRLAEEGGADRIELCARLAVGGVTPSIVLLRHALEQLAIPIFPLIRPRGGDFVYQPAEVAQMLVDIGHARALGARAVVIGALTKGGAVDRDVLARFRDAAGPEMELSFHRAFDETANQFAALEVLIDSGINRVLTSGGAATAWKGRDRLARLVESARGRIVIMAGGKVAPDNAAELVAATGVSELHFQTDDAGKVRAIRRRSSIGERR